MNARVVSLQLHERRCDQPRAVAEVTARVGGGIEGDSHVAKTTRALLIVDRATLDDLGLRPGDLREQITVQGIREVSKLAPGTRLRIGAVTVEVNGECEPCTHIGKMIGVADPEELRASLVGRRGAVCTVVTADAPVRMGDHVEVLAPAIR